MVFVLVLALAEREKKDRGGAVFVAIVGIILLIAGSAAVSIEVTEGLPKDTYGPDHGHMLPPENLPLVVKMGYVEDGYYYMTATPYNEEDTVPIYYQIPIENLENFGDIKLGVVVINDDGILKKFPITLEV